MSIRHALPADVDTLADIEAASYPPAEGASRQSIAGRVAVYPDCFWLLDEGGEVKAFVNGFVTDMPDLTDEMYDDPISTRRRVGVPFFNGRHIVEQLAREQSVFGRWDMGLICAGVPLRSTQRNVTLHSRYS